MSRKFLLRFLLAYGAIYTLHAQAASAPAVEARHGMVVSSQAIASQVGVDILKQGGNAIDAAVAVGYAQAVVNPCCGNIGGGGFMLIHLAGGKETFINFRETAPAAARADMYLDDKGQVRSDASLHGYSSVAVPGTVMGLDYAQAHYGKLSRQQVMAPAIKLAQEGFVLTRADTDILDTTVNRFRQDAQAARWFLRADGTPLQPGDRLKQPELALTLSHISQSGTDYFYHSPIPQRVEAAAAKGGGIITAKDFADYRVSESAPLRCQYRGYEFISSPPPSSGGVALCEMVNIMAGYDMRALGFNSADSVHVMTEAMRIAYFDRNNSLGDPAFINNPLDKLLSTAYADRMRRSIHQTDATPSKLPENKQVTGERPETTHYSVVDGQGNAVSTTYTVNGRFGAVVMAPGTGFFLNDEMDDFTTKIGEKNMFGLVQGASNAIAPGKRPLSSMSPTIVTRGNKVFLVLGSPGGSRIITASLQAALNIIDYGMLPQEAVDAPRIHHQWLPDEVYYEQRGLSFDTLKLLRQRGYKMTEQTPWGATELIMVAPVLNENEKAADSGNDSAVSGQLRPGYLYGANDIRRPAGAAIGF
ncbi:gamma-glutamyltransferase [Erwinia pyrifoliae]|uniref:gamma-glutamyltransferase n=1 Tax=Erwinia pyrifoliae TaxID=79967 RepID=UPI00019612AA|nr:gamma-glutamyltransferase [Erwinia pyrifoliae]MCA8878284.1 gamma-glutamyltransferase [Erwinia pyrifoliae]MCT2385979.1 gamma-glutamyltransferase [Erwinia pyrifoliae]MCU8588435.1 gamma-glutamyltransferase [Erwinia pyrifoliae]UXK12837.1 gamma-glutamyltransferase [Erwinia pyrifoliae]CAX56899.1 Gamma-glutamyltranspeptidase [Erwinia pyrifoliae Ep1/96]